MDRNYQVKHMSEAKRLEWEFEYTCGKLVEGARQQRDYRRERLKVWEGKKEEVIEKIKSKGLTVHENIAEKMASYSNTGGGSATVLIDPTLQRDLNECTTKIQSHRELATVYDSWLQVLQAQPPQTTRQLTHDDWMFFFGR